MKHVYFNVHFVAPEAQTTQNLRKLIFHLSPLVTASSWQTATEKNSFFPGILCWLCNSLWQTCTRFAAHFLHFFVDRWFRSKSRCNLFPKFRSWPRTAPGTQKASSGQVKTTQPDRYKPEPTKRNACSLDRKKSKWSLFFSFIEKKRCSLWV